jgi:hypothetical protein
MTGSSDAVLRRMSELTRATSREQRRPGASYEIDHREYLGLHRIRARLLRGARLSEREQRALGRLMHQLLEPQEPCRGVVRKPLAVFAEPPPR